MSQEQDLDWLRQLGDLVCRSKHGYASWLGVARRLGCGDDKIRRACERLEKRNRTQLVVMETGGSHSRIVEKSCILFYLNGSQSNRHWADKTLRTHHRGDRRGTRALSAHGLSGFPRTGRSAGIRFYPLSPKTPCASAYPAELQPLGSGRLTEGTGRDLAPSFGWSLVVQ